MAAVDANPRDDETDARKCSAFVLHSLQFEMNYLMKKCLIRV